MVYTGWGLNASCSSLRYSLPSLGKESTCRRTQTRKVVLSSGDGNQNQVERGLHQLEWNRPIFLKRKPGCAMKTEGSELLECKAYVGGDHVTSTFVIHEPHRKTPLAIFSPFYCSCCFYLSLLSPLQLLSVEKHRPFQ